MRAVILTVIVLGVSACSSAKGFFRPSSDAVPASEASEGQMRPQARGDSVTPQPPTEARTVEEFDTTTAAERAEAAAAPEPAGEQSLGTTVASLGDVSRPGFWLETPLVTSETKGRVHNPATGKSAQVDLIPIDGPATAGSRISLAAMRLIEAGLTDLPTVEVYSGG